MNAEFLPTAIPFGLLKSVFESEHLPELFDGDQTHDPALRFIDQIVRFSEDPDYITSIIGVALPEGYAGNTLDEIPGIIEGAIEKGFNTSDFAVPKTPSLATICLQLVELEEVILFHNDDKTAFASVSQEGGGRLTYAIEGSDFAIWLDGLFYRNVNKALSLTTRTQVIDVLKARARFDGPRANTHLRIGGDANETFIDLGDGTGCAVKITSTGWSVVADCPIYFRRTRSIQPLPVPQSPVPLERLQQLLGLNDDCWLAVLAFILNALKPGGPYMCLLIEAEQGSGKSVLSTIIKRIVDPNLGEKLRLPKTEQDLAIHAQHNFLLVYDNSSNIKWDMSDALCGLATGSAFGTRKLYTDSEMSLMSACRPFIINGIGEFAHRPDLLERAIPLKLPPFQGQRRSEEEIFAAFEELLPGLLATFYDIVAGTLSRFADVSTPSDFRMADAAKWLAAAEPACGLTDGTFINFLKKGQTDLMIDRALNDSLTNVIMRVINDRAYEGTVGELFGQIDMHRPNGYGMLPRTPSHLSGQLGRLRPSLEKIGIHVEIGERSKKGRMVRIWREDDPDDTTDDQKADSDDLNR